MKPEANELTLRDAFERFIRPELERKRTISSHDLALKRWEQLTGDPKLAAIDNATVAAFRRAMIDAAYSPHTIRNTWGHLRVVLRRCGPPVQRNPWGESIIDRIPAMKPVKVTRKFPRIFTLDELSRIYEACESRRYPECVVPAPDWWRSLIVLAYCCGARPIDLFAMTPDAVDFERGTVSFLQSKVQAWHFVPLPPPARLHLERIRSDRPLLFPGGEAFRYSRHFYGGWRELLKLAGIGEHVEFYALRKTCATFWDRIERGMGAYVLGHSLKGTAATYYLNVTDDLFDAAEKLPQPEAFTRIVDDPRLQANVVCAVNRTRRTDWAFTETTARFRDGEPFRLPPRLLRCLQVLVAAGSRPVTFDDFRRLVFWDRESFSPVTVKTTLGQLRKRLVEALDLGPYFNPIPCPGNAGYLLRAE